jgi:DNA-binding transcriptional ArsR family regulator
MGCRGNKTNLDRSRHHGIPYALLSGLGLQSQGLHHTMTPNFEALSQLFYSLSSPNRLRLLFLLSEQSCNAPLVAQTLQTSYANALKQLGILESAGWIQRYRVNNTFFYSLHRRWVLGLVEECGNLLHSKNT